MKQLFVGPVIHSNEKGELIIFDKAAILVENGKIKSISSNAEFSSHDASVVHLNANQFLIPGFVDCHIHAVQFPNIGIGYAKCLLDWLESYTFPLELKYSDNNFAKQVMDIVVKRTLETGTTTACYFASLYAEASLILAKTAVKFGQRAFIGKVNMNTVRSDGYWESTKESINGTAKFIADVFNIGSPLIKPVITPRFVLSCDMELMKTLGEMAKKSDICIQTHISENIDEVKIVEEKYKEYESYSAIYDAAGLLTNKTILAHGVYLKDDELNLLKERDCAIIHCPSSNTFLKSGLCDVQRLKKWGLKIGLGTDVAGSPSSSILEIMRSALQVSNHISFQKSDYQPLDYKDVFHMATLGGATCLSLKDQIGNFEPGKQFDALIIDVNTGPLNNFKHYTLSEQLQRFIYNGDDRNIEQVYVSGQRVK